MKNWHLKDLTYKVVMLILLVSSQRRQTVHSLDLKHLCVEEDKYIFDIDEHMKTSSPRNPNTRIEIARYERMFPFVLSLSLRRIFSGTVFLVT